MFLISNHLILFFPNITAPTIATNNKMEDTSNGNKNSPNNVFPRFSINPILGLKVLLGTIVSAPFKEPTITTNNKPDAIAAENFNQELLWGSVSLFKFISIITKRKSTIIAPAYTMTWTAAKNWAFI